MRHHNKLDFQLFMSQLSDTNATLDFWTDFEKVKRNVAEIEIKLNTLNYLLGKSNFHEAVTELWQNDNRVFDVLQILIAVRDRDKKRVVTPLGDTKLLETYLTSLDGVIQYLDETGLSTLFKDKNVKNLVDYVFGIEVGLDSNARKNRSGHAMENAVEAIIKRYGISYRKEVTSSEWPAITEALGTDKKRFDFVLYSGSTTYLVEVNFYSGRGSKLNETARSFSEIAPKINSVPGFEFVWITDGRGWEKAKSKLEEAFYAIPNVYNLKSLKDFLLQIQ